MEPVTIALICAAAFGAVVALSVFIRQLVLSRDKNMNDEAQRKALTQEAGELEKMREQMQSNQRFDSHYKVLGANKDAIVYLDTKIDDILHKKTQLIERYAQVTLKESGAIVDGTISVERKQACDRLKVEIDAEIKFYDSELEHLQKRRTSLWDTHTDLQEYLVGQEKARNENLDSIYKQHSNLLEKIYIRHTDNSEHIAKQTIAAGTLSFKQMIMAPIHFLLQYFNISTGVSLAQSKREQESRDEVGDTETDVNESSKNDSDVNSNNDDDTDAKTGDDVKTDDEISTDEETNTDDAEASKDESQDDSDSEKDSRLMTA